MAHLEKYKMSDVKRVISEHNREDTYTDHISHIDEDRTKYNYIVADTQSTQGSMSNSETFKTKLGKRINQLEHSNRKDLVVMGEWCVTCPQELLNDPAKVKEFCQLAVDFTAERYGSENVFGGYVHLDETTTHVHIPVVPEVDGRVCAKQIFTRGELSAYHKALDRECEARFGLPNLILNGRTKGGYTTNELRQRTKDDKELTLRRSRLVKREQDVEQRESAVARRESAVNARERIVEDKAMELQAIERNVKKRRAEVKERERVVDQKAEILINEEKALREKALRLNEQEQLHANAIKEYRERIRDDITLDIIQGTSDYSKRF